MFTHRFIMFCLALSRQASGKSRVGYLCPVVLQGNLAGKTGNRSLVPRARVRRRTMFARTTRKSSPGDYHPVASHTPQKIQATFATEYTTTEQDQCLAEDQRELSHPNRPG